MSEPIRVLEVTQRMEAAGAQTFLMNMYSNMDRSKVQMDFLVHYTAPNFYDDEINKLGGHIYRLSVREDYNLIKYKAQLRKLFNEHKEYHIIHGHMDTLGAIYLKQAKECGIPVRIAHAHTDSVQNGIKKIPRLLMIKEYKKYATNLMACANDAGKFMFENSPFMVIHNGIDVRKFAFNSDMREKKRGDLGISNRFVIGNVGRFHVQKNQLFLLEIISEIKKRESSVVLLLIGSGEMENEIRKKINELSLQENVIILQNRRDVNELEQAMDVYVMPSLYEGLSLSAVEAETSGLPCVFSNGMSRETELVKHVVFMPLSAGAKAWADEILKYKDFYRIDCSKDIVAKGYDAREQALKLQDMYLNLHNNSLRQ